MKTSLVVVGSLLVGAALGVGTTAARFELARGASTIAAPTQQPEMAPPGGPQPKVEVDQEDYDFGAMERGGTQSHSFVFTNVGDYPLELVQGETTCKCTISQLDTKAVPPGESVKVTLQWTAKTLGNRFRQSATIHTNDPKRPRVNLTVSGAVSQSVEAMPRDIVFSKVQVGESKTAEVKLVSYAESSLKLTEQKFSEKESADKFEVASRPLTAEELPEEAKSGLLLTVTLKPGLPVGPLKQQLEIMTDAAGSSLVVLPITGRIVSEISVFGPGWDAARGVLALGTIKSDKPHRHELSVFIRGEHADQVSLEMIKVDPDVLHVSFGEKQTIKEGAVVKIPLIIEIPAGARSINRLGSDQSQMGEILLQTNHAQAKQLRLFVHFAVEQ